MAFSSVVPSAPAALAAPTVRRMANGLTIIAQTMPVEAVNLSVWLRVGSAIEDDAINGMAHYLEHMLFKGTAELPCGEFERRIEARGAVVNAVTSQDYTHLYLTTAPSDFAQLAPLAIQLVMAPRLEASDFERERGIILEEIRRAADNPRRRTYQHTVEQCFDRLPYRRPVLGPAAVVESLTVDQLRQFHQTWYQPPGITAVAVGNLPVDALIATVEQGFEDAHHADSSRPGRHIHQFRPRQQFEPEPPFPALRRAQFAEPALTQGRLVLAWRVPGIAELETTYPLDALASVLGRGRLSRLVRDLREERGLVSGIGCHNMVLGYQGLFTISAQADPCRLEEVEAIITDHLHQLATTPITEAELTRIRTQVANRYIFANETPSDRAGLYGYYHTLLGDISPALTYPAAIQRLDQERLQSACQQFLPATTYSAITLVPAV